MTQDKRKESFTFAEVFPDKNECDREAELFRYFEGRLSADEEKPFEKHLATCGTCAGKLAALQQEDRAVQDLVLDSEQAGGIFEKNRARLRGALDAKYAPVQSARLPFLAAFRMPAGAGAFMILLLAVLIYPAYRSFVLDREIERLRGDLESERSKNTAAGSNARAGEIQRLKEANRELTEPSLSSSAVYSARSERAGEHPTITVNFQGGRGFDLVFALPPASGDCMVEVVQGTTPVWRREISVSQANPLISIHLQPGYFHPGEYNLRISERKDGEYRGIVEYRLMITSN